MRRMSLICAVVFTCATAAVAGGAIAKVAGHGHHHVAKSHHSKTRHRPKHRRHRASRSSGTDPVLFGDRTVESGVDENAPGTAEAFPYMAALTGQAQSIAVYVDSHNTATTLIAGVYTDHGGAPGSLITQARLRSPQAGAWNTISVPSAPVTDGQRYWIALLGRGGHLSFRDRTGGPCDSQTSRQSALSTLPAGWQSQTRWNTCPASAYVGGTATPASVTTTTSPTTTTPPPTTSTPTTTTPTTPPTTTTTPAPPPPAPSGTQTMHCFSSPAACGYPDAFAGWTSATGVGPNNGTTGVACSSLPTVSGNDDATTNGQTIANVDVLGQIHVDASNVTINNVCVQYGGGNASGTQAIQIQGGSNILIENSDIGGVNDTTNSVDQAVADNGGSGVTLQHDYLHNCIECLHDHPFTVINSYVLSNGGQSTSGLHTEDLYYNNDYANLNIDLEHDTLFNPYYQTAVVFADSTSGNNTCFENLTVKGSLISGGSGMLNWCGKTTSPGSATFDVQGNDFARCTTTPYVETSGGNWTCSGNSPLAWEYGSLAGTKTGSDTSGYYEFGGSYAANGMKFCSAGTWSANTWDDNGAPVACTN